MSNQLTSSQDVVLNYGWPGALPVLQASGYLEPPPEDSPDRSPCRVFLGPNPSNAQYSHLEDHLRGFNEAQFSRLILTVYPRSLSRGQIQEIRRLIGEVDGRVEWRMLDPATGLEKLEQRTGGENDRRVTSSVYIPVDSLDVLLDAEVNRICTLDNIELVRLLPPMTLGQFGPCTNAMQILWQHTPMLKKCILPLDLFDHLSPALVALSSQPLIDELELTFPKNDEGLRYLYPQVNPPSYEPTMNLISPLLAQLTRLKAMTIPMAFVSAGKSLSHIATLPCLSTLTVVPVDEENPVADLLEALWAASIKRRGARCFPRLLFLDMPLGARNLNSEHSSHLEALSKIFVDTVFCGAWLEWENSPNSPTS